MPGWKRRADDSERFTEQGSSSGSGGAAVALIIILLIVLLAVVTITAFIHSLICFGRSGTTTDKVVGVLVAWFTGPFFYLYRSFNKGYCRIEKPSFFGTSMF